MEDHASSIHRALLQVAWGLSDPIPPRPFHPPRCGRPTQAGTPCRVGATLMEDASWASGCRRHCTAEELARSDQRQQDELRAHEQREAIAERLASEVVAWLLSHLP